MFSFESGTSIIILNRRNESELKKIWMKETTSSSSYIELSLIRKWTSLIELWRQNDEFVWEVNTNWKPLLIQEHSSIQLLCWIEGMQDYKLQESTLLYPV